MSLAALLTAVEARLADAATPHDLFGSEAKLEYRRLARMLHPDGLAGVTDDERQRAAAAIAKINAMWERAQVELAAGSYTPAPAVGHATHAVAEVAAPVVGLGVGHGRPMSAPTLTVLVCGDRRWSDPRPIHDRLDKLWREHPVMNVVEGGAKGADRMAGKWAAPRRFRGEGVGWVRCDAYWRWYGRAAGPIRNRQMLEYMVRARELGHRVLVLAFHDDLASSLGTRNMVEMASKAGLPGVIVKRER